MNSISKALIAGDALVLLVFSSGGIAFHRTPGEGLAQLARIGLPFALGYFAVAALLGALKVPASGWLFAKRTLGAWALGMILGMLLRIIAEGRVPIASFFVVSFTFTGVVLILWRLAYWKLYGRKVSSTNP